MKRLFSKTLTLNIIIPLFFVVLSLSCKSKPLVYFEKAKEFDEKGDFSRALLYYERIYDLYPDSKLAPESLMRAARISRLYLGKIRSALGYLDAILINYPDSEYYLPAQKEIADIYMDDLKNYDRAVSEYSKLIQLNPPKEMLTEARLRIARCFEGSGNYDQALIEFNELLNTVIETETKIMVEYEINVIHYIKKNLKESIKGLEEFIKKYPESELIPDAKFYLASAYSDSNEFGKALELLHEIEDTYRNPEALKIKAQGIEARMKKIK